MFARLLFNLALLLAKGGAHLMTEQQKRIFATTYVHLILNGRRTIDEVPEIIRDIVMADLGMTPETTE